jgi:PAS domain S-box-containing protein
LNVGFPGQPSDRGFFDLEPEDIIGKKDIDLLPPEFIPKMAASEQAIMETGRAEEFEEVIRFKSGERVLRVYKTPYRDGNGNIIGIIGILRDITQHKRAEQALLAQRQLLDTIIETIPHGIFWKNRDLTYAGCNSKAAQSWGWSGARTSSARLCPTWPSPGKRPRCHCDGSARH